MMFDVKFATFGTLRANAISPTSPRPATLCTVFKQLEGEQVEDN